MVGPHSTIAACLKEQAISNANMAANMRSLAATLAAFFLLTATPANAADLATCPVNATAPPKHDLTTVQTATTLLSDLNYPFGIVYATNQHNTAFVA